MMSSQSQHSPQAARATQEDIRRDLQASLEARRELGPEYDEHFLDALVEKLTKQVQQTQQTQQETHVSTGKHSDNSLALAICSLIFGIPIVAIAGGETGLTGIIVACAMIVGVNLAFNLRR
jgi:sugar (pentulose or hexulose) kinase